MFKNRMMRIGRENEETPTFVHNKHCEGGEGEVIVVLSSAQLD